MKSSDKLHWLPWLARVVFILAVGGALFGVFLFPTRHFQALLGAQSPKLARYEDYLCFLTLFALAIAYAFKRAAYPPTKTQPTVVSAPRRASRLRLAVQILLSVLILARTGMQITAPFDYDEQVHASRLSRTSASEIAHPLQNTSFHLVATLASYESTKLFGVNKISVRLPALLFTAVWLVCLNLFSLELTGLVAVGILLGHCLTNELLVWYLHSMRGYASMLCLTFLPFWILYRFVKRGVPQLRTATLWALAITFPLPLFTHAFGGFFCLLLLCAFLVWMGREANSMTRREWRFGWSLAFIALAWVPVLSYVLLKQFIGTDSEQQVFFVANTTETGAACLSTLLGLARAWWLKLALVAFALVGCNELRSAWRKDLGFLAVFLGLAFIFFSGTSLFLRTPVEGRFLLPFLPLFLLWFGEALERSLKGRGWPAVLGLAFVCFIFAPWQNSPDVFNRITQEIDQFQTFVETARKISGNLPSKCYSFSGDKSEVGWAKDFYFVSPQAPSTLPCAVRYSLHFPLADEPPRPLPGYQEIFRDAFGRSLWAIPASVVDLANN
jgi:hypothetical protein